MAPSFFVMACKWNAKLQNRICPFNRELKPKDRIRWLRDLAHAPRRFGSFTQWGTKLPVNLYAGFGLCNALLRYGNIMPSIKKILFPVDFSESCLAAARYVEAFAGRFEAEVMLFHTVHMGEHSLAEELQPHRQAQLDAFLADEFKYFETQRICVTGEPATEILEAALHWRPDLVMMPTHGLGAFRRLLLGSVTAKALHDLDCPVWTSAHMVAPPPLEAIHFRRILCALDLTERSGCVLDWATWLAAQCKADLGIIHASAELPSEYYGWDLEKEFVESVAAEAKGKIEKLQTAAGSTAQVFVTPGYPSTVVAGAVRNFDADLLVMGRHSGGGIGGYLRHNAYAILRDSPCPVVSI